MFGAEFWVAIAFFIFIGIVLASGAHKKVINALDDRAVKIVEQLNEAERLRAEAAQLLQSYEGRRIEAEREAQAIVTAAREEARRYEAEAKGKLEEFIKRKQIQAEEKIIQAESQALTEVRVAAVRLATEAASRILSAGDQKTYFETALGEVKAQNA